MKIRKYLACAVIVTNCFMATAQNSKPAIARDEKVEQQVEQIVGKMSLHEKIGQMTEMAVSMLGHEDANHRFVLEKGKLDTVINIYKVGSILNVTTGSVPTPEQWQTYLTAIQDASMKSIGVPCVYGLDQNHGTTYTLGGILFPQNINLGASFNCELAQKAAEICAYETRAGSCPWVFSPVLDLTQNQAWPRVWENFGEDCYLTSEMGKSAILGFQGADANHIDQRHVGACLKHYLGYGATLSGKDRTPSIIAPQAIKEKHFAPFKAAIEAGALSVMVNSGSVNYMPVHANYELLTKWLKEDLQWDGVIITDWSDIDNLHRREKVAKDKKEAICLAINAGIDMTMDPYDLNFCNLLEELVKEGRVPMSRIDDAAKRVVRMKIRMGLMEHPTQNAKEYTKFGCKEHAAVALQAAEESMVLLKNDGLLPLQKGKKYLVTGPNANSMRSLNGAWSYTWQGNGADEYAKEYNTIYEALSNKFGKNNVNYVQSVEYVPNGKYDEVKVFPMEPVIAAAKKADVLIVCIGENTYCETPGNLSELALEKNQQELVKELAKTGKTILLVLNEGRPRIIREIEPLAKSIVNIMLPGNHGGDALANLLSGESNFSGKLPYTYPLYSNALSNYDYRTSEESGTMGGAYNYDSKVSMQWPFGFGLSYTKFEYSNLRVDKTDFTANDVIKVSVNVKNIGDVDGKESVLLYSSDLVASITPENKRLRNFTKIELKAGESKTVTFELKATDLAFVGYDNRWVLEPGEFDLTIANQKVRINCTQGMKE